MPILPKYDIKHSNYSGHTMYGNTGSAFLREGCVLSQSSLQVLESRGMKPLYVYKPKDLEVESESLLPPDLHNKANNLLNQTFRIAAELDEKQIWEQNATDLDGLVFEMLAYFQAQSVSVLDLIEVKCCTPTMVKHSINVGILSCLLALHLGLSEEEVHQILKAGLLHDIGKVFISPDILYKPGELSSEEVSEIEKHPGTGYRLLVERYSSPASIGLGSLLHHERWNGGGYPYHLRGTDIHLYGRIIAVADVFDAMTSERVYRRSLSYASVLAYLEKQAGVYFDPEIIAVMQRIIHPDLAPGNAACPPNRKPPAFSNTRQYFKTSPIRVSFSHEKLNRTKRMKSGGERSAKANNSINY